MTQIEQMSPSEMNATDTDLPSNWALTSLGDSRVAEISPRWLNHPPSDQDLVTFLPMADVEAGSGKMHPVQQRLWSAVKKGYTPFQDGDVLFAKITPCMENGKCALATGLLYGRGAGSTEFHVVRPTAGIHPRFLLHFLLRQSYRQDARMSMQGAAGQLRVPVSFLELTTLGLPPISEQFRIVAEIEKQFSRLDAAVAALKRVQANLKRYRAAVLKAACEGRLVPTEAELARREGRDFESADVLLQRILSERRARWEADQLAKMEAQGRLPLNDTWKAKYQEPAAPDIFGLPQLPEGWNWTNLPQLGELGRGKSKHRPRNDPKLFGGEYPFLQTAEVKHSGGFIRHHLQTYSETGLHQSKLWPTGTLCITIAANIAETGILTYPACFPDSVVGFVYDGHPATIRFISLFFQTAKEEIARYAPATAQKNINLETLQDIAIPLPPFGEQVRIVEEFERRLSIIEEIEATVTRDLKRAERMRQAILKRAFSGRLVPHDPADEPASELLERIRAEQTNPVKPRREKTNPARRISRQMTLDGVE